MLTTGGELVYKEECSPSYNTRINKQVGIERRTFMRVVSWSVKIRKSVNKGNKVPSDRSDG